MTVRERNRRAHEYILRCSRKRVKRILWAVTALVWALLIGCVIWCISASMGADEPETPPVTVETEEPEIIPAACLMTALPRMGEFDITGYCACCTPYAHLNQQDGLVLTASGEWVEVGTCVAVDTDIIPLGSTVTVDGVEYKALDTGVNGFVVDILMSHEEAAVYGVRRAVVTWE